MDTSYGYGFEKMSVFESEYLYWWKKGLKLQQWGFRCSWRWLDEIQEFFIPHHKNKFTAYV